MHCTIWTPSLDDDWNRPATLCPGGEAIQPPELTPTGENYISVNNKEVTMKRLILTAVLAIFATTSVFAQPAVLGTEYYVVRDATTKKCTIVDKKPTIITTTIVDNGTFKTRAEAETAVKTMKECTDN
jgi:hypothetical protein